MSHDFEYSCPRRYRRRMLIAGLAIGVGYVALAIAHVVRGGGDDAVFGVFELAIGMTWGYKALFERASRVQVIGTEFRWQKPLSRGTVPLASVWNARPGAISSNIEVFEIAGKRNVVVYARAGIDDFVRELTVLLPDVQSCMAWRDPRHPRRPTQGANGFRWLE